MQLQASLAPFTDAKGVLGLHRAAGLKLLSSALLHRRLGSPTRDPEMPCG